MIELCLLVDAMRPRLVGREAGLFEHREVVFRVKKRERNWVDFCGVFRDVRRRLGRKRALGSGEATKK